ncbi:MAG: hypothetical protein JSV49_01715 [Thermoplasmata archaeon]|nr:MAG: hypothetical protein JSV49_01715 [Thermoplasmata archaeon]
MKVSGIIHIHSKYSYDGTESLEFLKKFYKAKGYKFIIVTEHTEQLSDSKFNTFISRCEVLSEPDFVIIPGVEVLCKNELEILALNVTKKFDISDPQKLIAAIQGLDGLAVLAHPVKSKGRLDLKSLKGLNGVEVWNYLHDSKNAPRNSNLKLLHSLRKMNNNVFAYAGVDFHTTKRTFELIHYIELDESGLEKKLKKEGLVSLIIDSLKSGRYVIGHESLKISSDAKTTTNQTIKFGMSTFIFDRYKMWRRISKQITKRLNINFPKFLYKIRDKMV